MQGMRLGLTNEDIFDLSKIDPWFISQFRVIYNLETEVKNLKGSVLTNATKLRELKSAGFSDKMLSKLIGCSENDVYNARKSLGINFEYNEVDTCAAEFKALTPYLYSTTNVTALPQAPKTKTRPKVMILGGGPNRIGQGIEFDYCCVHASFALAEMDIETIMYNCNPETVKIGRASCRERV